MAFNLGGMRIRANIERRALTQDTVGGQSETWSAVTQNVWLDMKALTGHELEAAQAVRATDTHQIILRYFPGLSAKDRFVYTDPDGLVHYYNITDVIDQDMRHRVMQCTAVEGLAVG